MGNRSHYLSARNAHHYTIMPTISHLAMSWMRQRQVAGESITDIFAWKCSSEKTILPFFWGMNEERTHLDFLHKEWVRLNDLKIRFNGGRMLAVVVVLVPHQCPDARVPFMIVIVCFLFSPLFSSFSSTKSDFTHILCIGRRQLSEARAEVRKRWNPGPRPGLPNIFWLNCVWWLERGEEDERHTGVREIEILCDPPYHRLRPPAALEGTWKQTCCAPEALLTTINWQTDTQGDRQTHGQIVTQPQGQLGKQLTEIDSQPQPKK